MCQKAIFLKIDDVMKTRIWNDNFHGVIKTKISLENNGRSYQEDNKKINENSWENKQQECEESKQRIGNLNRKTIEIVKSSHRNWDRSTNRYNTKTLMKYVFNCMAYSRKQ